MPAEDKILLSVVITMVGGPRFLTNCLENLLPQIANRNIEVIVPYQTADGHLMTLMERFRQVTFVQIDSPEPTIHLKNHTSRHELFDLGKSLGLSIAKGEYIALLDDQGSPAPNWCDEIIEASHLPYEAIGGAIEHTGIGLLNWAVYFTDFGRYQLPFAEGKTDYLSDINIFYRHSVLDEISETWKPKYNEVAVNWKLIKEGHPLWKRPGMVVNLDRGELIFIDLIRERYAWGKIFGGMRARNISRANRMLYMLLAPLIPFVILARIFSTAISKKRNIGKFFLSSPCILVFAMAWVIGEWSGYVGEH